MDLGFFTAHSDITGFIPNIIGVYYFNGTVRDGNPLLLCKGHLLLL